jgi:hypothetical protein
MLRKTVALCLIALSACVPAPVADPVPATPDTCGMAPRAAYVGQPVAALVTDGLAGGARIIRPGEAVTEDYSDTRLNVDVDAADVITRLWCG